MQTLVIVNQKGGCGKTTTAISLAGIFASLGKRTLLVDLDPQSHCAAGLAIPEQRIDLDIGDAMLSDTPVEKSRLVWRVSRGLDLIPSRLKLAGLEAARGGLASKPDKERRLARVLGSLKTEYDIVLVDCSPSVGLLTYNALAAATKVVVPVETSFFSLQGATKQVNTIKSLERRLDVSAPYCILPTIHEPESALAEDLIGELHRRFEGNVCPTAIRRDAKLKEAASFGQPVSSYAPDSTGARDYAHAADWILPQVARPETPTPIKPKPEQTAETSDTRTKTPTVEPKTPAATTKTTGVAGAVKTAVGTAIKATRSGRLTRQINAPTRPAAAPATPALETVGASLTTTAPTTTAPTAGVHPATGRPQSATGVIGTSAVRLVTDEDTIEPARQAVMGTIVLAPEHNKQVQETKKIEAPNRPGVYPDGDGMWFVQPLHAGETVAVAGDFNHWTASTHVMEKIASAGIQRIRLPLLSGRYRYRLVIDGRWICDPTNPGREPNEFGDFNSVAHLP